MVSFKNKERSCACHKNVVRGDWSMASLAIENKRFLVLTRSLLMEFDGITWKQWSFVVVVFARLLSIDFDGMTCFCFRENVVERIWWHLLNQRFFPCSFYQYNLMSFQQNLCWWNLTALHENKEDYVLVVETFEPNYNKQPLFFNVSTCSQSVTVQTQS